MQRVLKPDSCMTLEDMLVSRRNGAEVPNLKEFMQLCSEFQRCAGDSAFGLSAQRAADALGDDPEHVWRLFRLLEHYRILRKVMAGGPFRAASYRYEPANEISHEAAANSFADAYRAICDERRKFWPKMERQVGFVAESQALGR